MAKTAKKLSAAQHSALDGLPPRRRAIVSAAFSVLMERGYAGASTLEIATRAKVSKRELYAEFGNKQGILEALIATTAARMQVPLSPPEIGDRHAFASALIQYGVIALSELTSPPVLAIYRLAIAESGRSADLGQILDHSGREPNRKALVDLMRRAQAAGFIGAGDPDRVVRSVLRAAVRRFDPGLLLGVIPPPTAREIKDARRGARPQRYWRYTPPRMLHSGMPVEAFGRKAEEADEGRRDVDQAARLPRTPIGAAVVHHQERPRLVRSPAAVLAAADRHRLAAFGHHPALAGNAVPVGLRPPRHVDGRDHATLGRKATAAERVADQHAVGPRLAGPSRPSTPSSAARPRSVA